MIIGITGSFGSGKTTVAKMFSKLGAYVIDADKVYHSLISPGKSCYKNIVRHFGKGILNRAGRIDRKKLGKIVFKDKTKLRLLNNLTHPEIMKEVRRLAKLNKGRVIVEASLLIESGFYKEMDRVILVANEKEEQVKRIRENKGLPARETLKRIRMQAPFKKKAALADFIIDNGGSKTDTLTQVKEIWEKRGV